MKSKTLTIFAIFALVSPAYIPATAQVATGGGYTLEQSVIASGGGGTSSATGGALDGAPFSATSGFWNFTAPAGPALTYEADVAGRPHGDQTIQSNDTVQAQRFEIGLDRPFQSNEFQRADSAPADTRGNGVIDSADTTQAQRYEIGLDARRTVDGPTAPVGSPPSTGTDQTTAVEAFSRNEQDGVIITRRLRVQSTFASAGQPVTVNILADAVGDESGYGFTLTYADTRLMNPSVAIGTAGGSRFCNTTVAGQITCSVRDFPLNNPSSTTNQIGEIAAGTNQILVRVTFMAAMNAPTGATALTLSNVNASNDAAQSLTITSQSGTVTISGPTAASVSINGRVIGGGRGLASAIVTLTDSSGSTRTARTTSFGYYRFDDVEAGQTYIASAQSKRYQFAPQVVSVTEDLSELNFYGIAP